MGLDVTAELGVRKWEAVIAAGDDASTPAGAWPHFIKKTDQQRVQNIAATLWDVSEDPSLAHEPFEITVKLDGSSCTVFHNAGEVGVCSRNLLVWKGSAADVAHFAESSSSSKAGGKGAGKGSSKGGSLSGPAALAGEGRFSLVGKPIAARLAALRRNIAIQGELMGPNIQGNREKLLKPTLFAFDIWDIDAQCHLPATERRAICKQLGIQHAPVLHEALPLRTAYPTLESLLAYADGLPSLNHAIAEGLVAKSVARPGFSFKAIANRFLLKCEA